MKRRARVNVGKLQTGKVLRAEKLSEKVSQGNPDTGSAFLIARQSG